MEQELENVENVEQTTQQVDETKFMSADDDSVIKVDLNKPIQDEKPEEKQPEEIEAGATDDAGMVGVDESTEPAQKQEEVQPQGEVQEETPVLEEITSEEVKEKVEEVAEQAEEAIAQAETTGNPLPENIQKLVDFMEETGGSLEDYVMLNQDYSDMDNLTVLQEYYKLTKPHLNAEERAFLMEETFSYDEEVDEEKDIRKKKIALKEQVAEAKAYLDGQKSKYYDEIKAGSKLTPEQQKAWDFFNRYNKESEEKQQAQEKMRSTFNKQTESLFNNEFKGFEYSVGDKRFRVNVKDVEGLKGEQRDMNNFIEKFLNKDGSIINASEYHKSIYTASNADAIAKHFYEQGRADAIKDSVAKSKNINMQPRQGHKGFEAGGVKVKVLGNDSSDFKFKFKNKK